MSRGDVDALLRRALERSADAAAVELTIARASMTRWASATFAGARHELHLQLAATPAAEGWLARLPEADLPLRGHLLADLKLVVVARTPAGIATTVELLTVKD